MTLIVLGLYLGAGGSSEFATSGDLATDLAQTFSLANSLSGLGGGAAASALTDAYATLQDLIAFKHDLAAQAMAAIRDTTASNVDQLSQFLDNFGALLYDAGEQAAADLVSVVKADIEFKKRLINGLVDMTKNVFDSASQALAAGMTEAATNLEAGIQQAMKFASAVEKAKMNLLLSALRAGDSGIKSAMAAAMATGGQGGSCPVQSLLAKMSPLVRFWLDKTNRSFCTY